MGCLCDFTGGDRFCCLRGVVWVGAFGVCWVGVGFGFWIRVLPGLCLILVLLVWLFGFGFGWIDLVLVWVVCCLVWFV